VQGPRVIPQENCAGAAEDDGLPAFGPLENDSLRLLAEVPISERGGGRRLSTEELGHRGQIREKAGKHPTRPLVV
jgi:hypothetical protein